MSHHSFLVLLLLPATCFLLHRILNRFSRFRDRSATKTAVTSILLAVLFTMTLIGIRESGSALLFGILTAPLLGHLYFQVFNLGETARRIRLLVQLKKTGTLSNTGDYTPQHMISIRLERLRTLNQVQYQEGKYSPRFTVLLLAALFLRTLERFVYPRRQTSI